MAFAFGDFLRRQGGLVVNPKRSVQGPPSLLWAESAQIEHQGCRLMQMTKKVSEIFEDCQFVKVVNYSAQLVIVR